MCYIINKNGGVSCMNFYGRENELNIINEFLSLKSQANLLIYGRRRIGKSYLIKKSLDNNDLKIIYYQCKDVNMYITLEELNKLLIEILEVKYLNFTNIIDLLDFVFSMNDIVLVLDEYPYLIKRIEGIDSVIQEKIDKYKHKSNMKFIISGSAIDIMRDLVDYSNPLYGRFDTIIKLEEQNYIESGLYYNKYSNEDKVKLYSIFGGEPYLNQYIDDMLDFKENVIKLAIKEGSALESFISSSIFNELNKINLANDVLLAIALGKHKNKEIADMCRNDSSKIDYVLNRLLFLGIIERINPINDLSNRKKTLYYIKSNSINFYYRYIYKNITYRNNMPIDIFYKEYIEQDFLTQYVPKVYEKISRDFLVLASKKGIIEPIKLIGTYWYDDIKNKSNGQFDVVTLDNKGYIFYEVKFIDKLIDEAILNEEIYSLNKLNINYYKLGFISKNGSTLNKEMYNLFSLDDLYNID